MTDDCCWRHSPDAYLFENDDEFGKIYRCPTCGDWYYWGELPSQVAERDAALPQPPCARCGGAHRFDTVLSNEDWNRVIRQGGPERDDEFLCLTCIVEAFTAVREPVLHARLVGGVFGGGGADWTIVLVRNA